ncbi:hypothetical protein [Aeromonas veronii]|uniref:hypothetical protein n=1 Tax=Aeromonas veronii TaxID=654 RepID=UPI003BA2C1C3
MGFFKKITKPFKKVFKGISKFLGLTKPTMENPKMADDGFELSTEGATRGIGLVYGRTRCQTSIHYHDVSNDKSIVSAAAIAGLTGRALEQRLLELRRTGVPASVEGEWLCTVATISHGPIKSIKQIYFSGEPILKDRDIQLTEHGYVPADYIQDKFKKQGIIIQYKTGKQDYFFNEVAARCPEYSGKMIGYGIAALAICFARDPENGEITTEPEIDVEIEGRLVLDTRTNQRVYSTNPAMCIRDYLLSDYSFQLDPVKIDDNAFIQFANYCDKQNYSMNGSVDTTKTNKANLNRMESDFQCGVVRVGDMWSVVFNAPSAAICTITDDDIIGPVVMDAAPTEAEFNELEVEYKDAAKNYQKDVLRYPNATRDEIIAKYGKLSPKKVQADFTTSKAQVDKIASTMFEMTRGLRLLKFRGAAKVYALNVGDVVNVQQELLGSLKPVPFRVNSIERGMSYDDQGTAEVELLEYKPNSFDTVYISKEAAYKPDPIRKVNAPSNLTFKITDVGYTLTGLLEWMPAVCSDFRDYVVQRRFTGTTEWEPQGTTQSPYMYLFNMPHGHYDFRVMTRTKYNEYSEPCEIQNIDVSDDTVLPAVTGLQLLTEDKDKTVSSGINFELKWDPMSDVVVKADTQVYKTDKQLKVKDVIRAYEVTIFHGANGGKKVQTVEVQEPNFTYTLDQNAANGLSRYCAFEVRIVSKGGARSPSASIRAKNTQCKQPTGITANSSVSGIQIEWDRCTENDFNGTRVYLSKTKGFTPTDANIAPNGDVKNNFYYKPETDGKWYGRIAHYDRYGVDELVFSPEMELFAQSIEKLMEQKDSAVMKEIRNDIAGVVSGTDNKILATKDELNTNITDAKKALSDADAKIQKDTKAAIDSARADLTKAVGDVSADVEQEIKDRKAAVVDIKKVVDANDAKAVQTATAIRTEMNNQGTKLQGAITDTNKSLSDKEKALVEKINTVEAGYRSADADNKALFNVQIDTLVTADNALGTRIDSLESTTTAANTAMKARVDNVQKTSTDADVALSKRIDALFAESKNGDAANKALIDSTNKALADKEKSIVEQITKLRTDSTNGDAANKALIDAANTAIANNEKATAESIKSTKAELLKTITDGDAKVTQAANAAVDAAEQAFTKANTALASTVQSVKADLTKLINDGDAKNTKDMQAAITETKTALVEGDKVIAKSVQDVSTKVQGVEGKVQQQQQVIQDINGNLTAKYIASVKAGDVFAGFELYGDAKTKTSKFAVEVDDFVVVNPANTSSRAVPFEVRDGKMMAVNAMIGNLDATNIRAGGINTACLAAGSITAEKLAAGSITGDKIVANVQLQTPDLLMGSIRLNAGAAGFGLGNGPYDGWGQKWSTIIYADGTLCTNKINASAGTITNLSVTNSTMQNCTIAQDCRVLGTLYADNIVGMPTGKSFGHNEFGVPRDGRWMTIAEHQIKSPQGRFDTISQIVVRGNAGGYTTSMYGSYGRSRMGIRVLLNGNEIFREMMDTPECDYEFHTKDYSWASAPLNIGSNGGYIVVQITTVQQYRYASGETHYDWNIGKQGSRDYNILSRSMQGYIYSAINK